MTATYGLGVVGVIKYTTDQKVNVTNYIHQDARERTHSNITYGVGIFILEITRLKTCLATKCLQSCLTSDIWPGQSAVIQYVTDQNVNLANYDTREWHG